MIDFMAMRRFKDQDELEPGADLIRHKLKYSGSAAIQLLIADATDQETELFVSYFTWKYCQTK